MYSKKTGKHYKVIAILLTFCMLFSSFGNLTVFASSEPPTAAAEANTDLTVREDYTALEVEVTTNDWQANEEIVLEDEQEPATAQEEEAAEPEAGEADIEEPTTEAVETEVEGTEAEEDAANQEDLSEPNTEDPTPAEPAEPGDLVEEEPLEPVTEDELALAAADDPVLSPLGIDVFLLYTIGNINCVLDWEMVSGAEYYDIMRGTKGTPGMTRIGTVSSGQDLRYEDLFLQNNTIYTYQVLAYQNGILIAESNLEEVDVNIDTNFPLNAATIGQDNVTLTWGASIDDYARIFRSDNKNQGPYTELGRIEYNDTSFTDNGLEPGTSYYYYIVTYDGPTPLRMGTLEIVTEIPIGAPQNIKADPVNATTIKVSWDALANADGYKIYKASPNDPDNFVWIATVYGQLNTSYYSLNLTPETTYGYKVSAIVISASGIEREGALAGPAYATTPPLLPGIPQNVKATGLDSSRIDVTWEAVQGATGYYVYRSNTQNGTYSYIGQSLTTNFINTGLPANTGYYYKVAAYNQSGTGEQSQPAYGKTLAPKPTKAPVCLCAKAVDFQSIRLTWKYPTACKGYNDIVDGYNIYRASSKYGPYEYVGSTSSTYYVDQGLNPCTTYYYRVTAYNSGGEGPMSCIACAKTKAFCPPACPKAKALSGSSMYVTWKAVSGADGYYVYRSTSKNGSYTLVGDTPYTSLTDTGLWSYTTYYYKIYAYYGADHKTSAASCIVYARTARY